MIIHQKIRKTIVELLQPQMTGIQHFYSGRPLFIDIDQDKSALAVFIDDIQCNELSLCAHEWEATLNIAEQVKGHLAQAIETESLPNELNEISLVEYSYEQDQTNRTWFVANIRYQIKYEG